MKMVLILALGAITASVLVGCSFSAYSQTAALPENIDDYRTGCEIDTDRLMAGYKQYEANEYYYDENFGEGTPSPTSTPSPITDAEMLSRIMLEDNVGEWVLGGQAGYGGRRASHAHGPQRCSGPSSGENHGAGADACTDGGADACTDGGADRCTSDANTYT